MIRFTNEDVVRNSGLQQAALVYVTRYTGTFAPLVEMRTQLVDEGKPLTTAQLRKVLNCMRHDEVISFSEADNTDDVPDGATVIPFRRPKPKPVPIVRTPRNLSIRWNVVWGYNTRTGKARRIHRLDEKGSYLRYYPADDRSLDESLQVHLRWLCAEIPRSSSIRGNGVIGRVQYFSQLISDHDALKLTITQPEWKLCKACCDIMIRRGIGGLGCVGYTGA